MSAHVKLFGRRPHEGLAPRTGAGVRKAARDETARGERQAAQQVRMGTGRLTPWVAEGFSGLAAGARMQIISCGMDVAKRGVFTFCAINDSNDLGVAERAQIQ